jgi:DNA-binding NarL/FixJ family response regulator
MAARILIADDHVAVRKMLRLLVETHGGWEVCGEAENGQEAVAKAIELKPDLVLTDLAMPVMDGIRASREISAAMPTVPILMHTLHYSAALELEAKKAGVRRVVAKAERGDELFNAIGALLNETAKSAPQALLSAIIDLPGSAVPSGSTATEGITSADGGNESLNKPD